MPARAAAPCAIVSHSEKIAGGTVAYNTTGAGPLVLLVHGLFADKEQWSALACLLAEAGYSALAVDLPGYGDSKRFPLSAYGLERQVDNLHALLARLKIDRFDIAGNSMGGTIAALYARRYPEQVRSVAYVGSPLGIVGWSEAFRAAVHRGINPFIPISESQLDLELGLLFVTPPALPDTEKMTIVESYVRNNRHFVQVWNIVSLYDDALAHRTPARLPTLILWGEDDRVFDVAGAQALQRRIPGSIVHRLPRAGHLLHMESAADAAPIYVDFLRSVAPSAPPAARAAARSSDIAASFACEAGRRVDAVFNNGGKGKVSLKLSDGREIALPQVRSGSGARYANADESFVFWNKGETAFVEENGKTTYGGCTARR